MALQKPPLYALPHGIEVIGEYAARGKNPYARLRIRPHRFFPDAKVVCNGQSVRKSRVMLASKLGRALTADEIAHHEDEDRTNDAPGNLEALTHAEHNRHHKTGSKHRADSKARTSAALKLAYAEGRKIARPHADQRGELNASAKLTWADVAEIRGSGLTNTALATQFNVCRRNIRLIKQGVTWK